MFLFVCAEISDYQQGDFNVVLLQWHGTRARDTLLCTGSQYNCVRTGKEDVNENVWKNANESRSICLERVPELRLKDHISCNNDPKLPFLWPFESSTYWHTSSRNKMRSAGGRIFLYLLTKLSKH